MWTGENGRKAYHGCCACECYKQDITNLMHLANLQDWLRMPKVSERDSIQKCKQVGIIKDNPWTSAKS